MATPYTTTTATGLVNIHRRTVPGTLATAMDLFGTLATDADRVWPADRWPRLSFRDGLVPGSAGGHGPIRYVVAAHEPGRRVEFAFTPPAPITGGHSLEISGPEEGPVTWTHTLTLTAPDPVRAGLVLPLHDACLEDLLDQVEAASAGQPLRRRPLPVPIRARGALLGLLARRPEPDSVLAGRRPVALASAATLAALAGLHLAWGAGAAWPAPDRAALAAAFDMDEVPGAGACVAVAGLLAASAGLTVSRVRPSRDRTGSTGALPLGVVDLGLRGAAAVLALRGVGGLVGDGLGRGGARFRRLDAALYAPLCLALAAGLASTTGALGRRPDAAVRTRPPLNAGQGPA